MNFDARQQIERAHGVLAAVLPEGRERLKERVTIGSRLRRANG